MLTDFEQSIINVVYMPQKFDKEEKELWSKGHIYCDGEVNNAFKIFRLGYSNARVKYL